ncbi:hypothetical protein KC343_g1818 [Hortaea werneckii]|nr:hypothetical protein KC352_g5489 [Hortaea werneckii]KAI7572559.1 hypothetical protein KC317_g659 [Hortaea werneckii]KAI7625922.1 hypothetical protein KC346_g1521 [Hortaea werneckii]KAI7635445.1 hypothetical protein KC343_g1818 [Hortaea werneckii]KAI7682570.1 hypothetical protein KC319_g935 [Hortaea werneckii]
MVAPPDYPWCYNCITRGCSSCDMRDTYPNPCTNCDMHFRNNSKKITCKRSGITAEEWATKKATEAQKLQQNATPMFQFGQPQQGQMPFPMFSPQLGQMNAAPFFPNMYQPQQWYGSMIGASNNSYPQQQQLPGSFPMSTPQLSVGAFGQKPSRNTLRTQRRRANARRSREEQMAADLADTQERLEEAERKLEAAARDGEQAKDTERRMPQRYPAPMQYPTQPPMRRQSGGDDQPPPAGNMHHPMQSPIQYPTLPLMEPPPGGHQQSPPAGDEQRQGYRGVEQRDYAQPPPGPLPTPIPTSSPVQMQQQVQSDSGEPPRAAGEDYDARKKRVMDEARAERNKPET